LDICPATDPTAPAPAEFDVTFHTTVKGGTTGDIKLHVTRAWSPNGVDRFYELLMLKPQSYYTENGFFRVMPGFVVQFGIAGDPTVSNAWANKNIPDDPVLKSNIAGTVSYATAGPNTRTTQLFINYADNSFLDSQGFSPFAQLIDADSMATAKAIFSGYGQSPSQSLIYQSGNSYLQQQFPKLDYLVSTTISNEVW